MATAEQLLIEILKTDPGVIAVFGNNPIRIYPNQIPQGASYPACAYQRVSTASIPNLSGRPSTVVPQIQLTVQGNTASSVASAVRALRVRLEGFRGTVLTHQVVIFWRNGENTEKNVDSGLIDYFADIDVWHNL